MPARPPAHPAAPEDRLLANLRIALVGPRGAHNVGAAARAMKNLGARDLVLIRPAFGRLATAERMAVHAADVVRAARIADDLATAVGDCRLVIGTTCRERGYRSTAEPIEVLAPAVLAAATQGPVAIVFGPEDRGLSNESLRHCQRLCRLDTSPDYPSLNLSQAVLLVCWELRRAARQGSGVAAGTAPIAPAAALQQLYDHLQAALLAIGFLNRQNPDHIMFALRALLGRAAPHEDEVQILRGIARQMEWAARSSVTGDRLPVTGDREPGDGSRLRSHRSPLTGYRSPS